jgi:hypothetical protein
MFENLIERLRKDIQVVKNVLTLHDDLRSRFYQVVDENVDSWAKVRDADPTRLAWQIYDHCAAFTRLYSIYEQFVEELVSEYLTLLPQLYNYADLPASLLKQHRLGIALILLKLSEDGPYRHLRESVIVKDFSRGIEGARPYTLLAEAFFIDRQNYRFQIVQKLLGFLGIVNSQGRIQKFAPLVRFLALERSGTQTVEGELSDFIEYRNEAAHREVSNVVATNEIKSVANFLLLLCSGLAECLREEVYTRRIELGQFAILGNITELYRKGTVGVARLRDCKISEGERLVVVSPGPNSRLRFPTVKSLQFNGTRCSSLNAKGPQEIGIQFDQTVPLGGEIWRIQDPPIAIQQIAATDEGDDQATHNDIEVEANEPQNDVSFRNE